MNDVPPFRSAPIAAIRPPSTSTSAFQLRSATVGFRQAVRERDEPFGDWKR